MQCIDAFAGSPWHVVMVVGENVELPSLPANFEVAPQFPQLAVLQHARVMLCHTGMNSTMESLYYGVPLISVPQMPEQAVNGGRVQELGLGRRLEPESLTAAVLRAAVDEVAADPRIRSNVQRFSQALRSVNGAALGVAALEELLDRAPLPRQGEHEASRCKE
jgi:MGT family glycosyltransferase